MRIFKIWTSARSNGRADTNVRVIYFIEKVFGKMFARDLTLDRGLIDRSSLGHVTRQLIYHMINRLVFPLLKGI